MKDSEVTVYTSQFNYLTNLYPVLKKLAYRFTEQYLRPSTTTQQTEQNRAKGTKWKYHKESKGNFKLLKPKSEHMSICDSNTPIPSKSYSRTLPHCTEYNFHDVRNYRKIICNNYNLRGTTERPQPLQHQVLRKGEAITASNATNQGILGRTTQD
uniref:Uncharacterized protein n=1 Tax=Lactuca sativa TaxID=4236 RepID=A0A9R1VAW6_LACSA|nr:hypothetical protein LSAT_V11C500241700 [Lactuca sativa]